MDNWGWRGIVTLDSFDTWDEPRRIDDLAGPKVVALCLLRSCGNCLTIDHYSFLVFYSNVLRGYAPLVCRGMGWGIVGENRGVCCWGEGGEKQWQLRLEDCLWRVWFDQRRVLVIKNV